MRGLTAPKTVIIGSGVVLASQSSMPHKIVGFNVAYELKAPGPCFLLNAVFFNWAYLLIDDTSYDDTSYVKWFNLPEFFHLVDCMCCCAILWTIMLSIKRLRETNLTYGKVGIGR